MKTILSAIGLAVIAAGLAACGGGGGSTPTPVKVATTSPTIAPTTAPGATKKVSTSPLSASPTISQSKIRSAQSLGVVGAQNLLIESAGTSAEWAGSIAVWVTDTATGQDVAETSVVTTATNGLAVNNPAPEPMQCTGADVTSLSWCAAHPLGWWFGTASVLNKPVGQQTITLTFGDGTVGTITDDVYNGFTLACGQSMEYQSGLPVIVTSNADVTYDCTNQSVDFPHGVVEAAVPTGDQFGRTNTVISTVTSAVSVPAGSPTSIPYTSFVANAVYVFATSDGGFAKMLVPGAPNSGSTGNINGIVLHAQAQGTYAY